MPRSMNSNGYSLLGEGGYLPLRKELSSSDRKLLSKFSSSRAKGRVRCYCICNHTDTKDKTVAEVFHRSDSDFKGYLTRSDLKVAVLELLGYKPCKEEVDGLITAHGDNNSPGLSEGQFQLAMIPKMAVRDEDEDIRETFLAFDTHCRGFLREEDVERVFRQVAPHLPTVTVATAFREIDQDGDGRISFRDFQMMMKYDFDCHI